MSTEECSTGNECCYQDDSGAQSLKHACVGLSAALFLALLALAWAAVARKYLERDVVKENLTAAEGQNGGAGGGEGEGSGGGGTERNNSSGERTRTGSPDSIVVEAKMKRQVSELSLRSLKSCRSLDNMELQPKTFVEPPSPASTVAADDITRLRLLLDSERSRRMAAENFLGRRASTPSSLGTPGARGSMRAFPTPRAVEGHALEAAGNAARWAQSAASRAGVSEPELPSLVKCVLVHLFQSCRTEIRRRLEVRLEGLRAFMGGTEAVYLGGDGVGMTGDTQDLLLGELRKRYHSIGVVGRKDLVKLSARVLAKALETEPQKELGRMLVHQTWPFFEPLVRSYLALFVECALQQPPIEFEDVTGKEEMFDPANHRELARFMEPDNTEINSTCCIVFPTTLTAKARWPPSDNAKSGVIIWGQKYFKL